MIQDIPYFFTNQEWWFYDWEEMKYKLTDKATEEAIESYKEFYDNLNKDNENENSNR